MVSLFDWVPLHEPCGNGEEAVVQDREVQGWQVAQFVMTDSAEWVNVSGDFDANGFGAV